MENFIVDQVGLVQLRHELDQEVGKGACQTTTTTTVIVEFC
jgi:hypothetical protein